MESGSASRARAPPFIDPPGYARHRPEVTLLYRLVERHYPEFVAAREAAGRPLPKYAREEFEAYLQSRRVLRPLSLRQTAMRYPVLAGLLGQSGVLHFHPSRWQAGSYSGAAQMRPQLWRFGVWRVNGLYNLSRGVASVLGFIQFGGAVWFANSLPSATFLASAILGVASILVLLVSPRSLADVGTRFFLIALCVAGIVAAAVLLDFQLSIGGEVEWDVILLIVLHIAALVMLAATAMLR